MNLPLADVDLFFRLHRALMCFVNERLKVLDRKVADPRAYAALPAEVRNKVQEALLGHRELIDAFVAENPSHFDESDLDVVRSWNHLVTGTFFAYRQLANHMVFLTESEPVVAYGVLALFDPFEKMIGTRLPRLIGTTLLPFKGRIVYDGLIIASPITFGPGIKRRLAESYKEAKASSGIVTSLPPAAVAAPRAKKAAPTAPAVGGATPAAARWAHDRIVELTDAFCRDHLDPEYAALCRKLAGILARKRPSPLARGKPASWASGIVRAVGFANFLGDPSQPHSMRMTDVDAGFGVSEATGSAKGTLIRKLLKIDRFDPDWTLPSLIEQNPLAWMIQVNGLVVDARHLPRAIQEEAFRKGLIPHVPGDRPDSK